MWIRKSTRGFTISTVPKLSLPPFRKLIFPNWPQSNQRKFQRRSRMIQRNKESSHALPDASAFELADAPASHAQAGEAGTDAWRAAGSIHWELRRKAGHRPWRGGSSGRPGPRGTRRCAGRTTPRARRSRRLRAGAGPPGATGESRHDTRARSHDSARAPHHFAAARLAPRCHRPAHVAIMTPQLTHRSIDLARRLLCGRKP